MKISDAIAQLDGLKHNVYNYSDKVAWLSRLDTMVKKHIIDSHEGGESIAFTGYTAETDPQTELLVPEPFDGMYLRWLEAQIDYYNGEYERYNQAMAMFEAEYNGYERWYNRKHMPIGRKMKYF